MTNPDYQQITFVMDGHDVGRLVFQVCHVCRTGYVANVSVDEPYQDRGIASRGLAALRAATPDYRWATSSQRRDARTFWQLTGRRSRLPRRRGVSTHRPAHATSAQRRRAVDLVVQADRSRPDRPN
jgi:hypothetical protein